MNKIYNNLTYRNLIKTDWIEQFDEAQKREIKYGIESQVDISVYAKTELNWQEMYEVVKILESKQDYEKRIQKLNYR